MGLDPDKSGRDRVLGAVAFDSVVAALVTVALMWWAIAAFIGLLAWSLPRWGSPTALYIAGIGAAVAYLVMVQLFPWASCLKCGGDSKVRDAGGRNWRYCIACGGSGKRRRLLARRER